MNQDRCCLLGGGLWSGFTEAGFYRTLGPIALRKRFHTVQQDLNVANVVFWWTTRDPRSVDLAVVDQPEAKVAFVDRSVFLAIDEFVDLPAEERQPQRT